MYRRIFYRILLSIPQEIMYLHNLFYIKYVLYLLYKLIIIVTIITINLLRIVLDNLINKNIKIF